MARYQANNLLGIGLMLLSMLLFVVMDALAKWLVGAEISAIQVVAIRSWIILAMIASILLATGKLGELSTRRPWHHLARGMIGALAPLFFFTALEKLPLADATVVFFTATFMLTAASALMLKERVGVHRWSAVAVGFVGVVIACDPGGGGPLLSYLQALGATAVYALIFVTGKQLSAEDSIISLVFSLHLGMGLGTTAALPWVWIPLEVSQLAQLLLMATIALVAHYIFTSAFALAEVSVLAPFEYTGLVWATLIGFLVWGDVPASEVWIGAIVIIGCGLYVVHRESLRPAG